MKTDGCTFVISSKDNRERDATDGLDDLVALINPSSKDLLNGATSGQAG